MHVPMHYRASLYWFGTPDYQFNLCTHRRCYIAIDIYAAVIAKPYALLVLDYGFLPVNKPNQRAGQVREITPVIQGQRPGVDPILRFNPLRRLADDK